MTCVCVSLQSVCRSDDDDEVRDEEVSKLIIVAQTPPNFLRSRKGGGVEVHTGDSPNVKYDSVEAKVIDDGLLHYESVSPHLQFWLGGGG